MLYPITILLLILAGTLLAGTWVWNAKSASLKGRLDTAREPLEIARFSADMLQECPAPVQRYLKKVLTEGQPLITSAAINQRGTINMGESGKRWSPFTARHYVVTRRPGFLWDARVAMLPGLKAHVHDVYAAGEGILQAALFGLIPVADMRGSREMAEGELMRYLAEAVWYPTALLPGGGLEWEAVDDSSARATLREGEISVTILFRFNADDLVESIRAEARGREVNGTMVPTPWEGKMWDYSRIDGMLIPRQGEIAWMAPEGRLPYWRGELVELHFEFST